MHAQEVFKELKLKNLSDYHDLYVQSDTLLLAYVFENFRNKYINKYMTLILLIFCLHLDNFSIDRLSQITLILT